MTTEYLRTHCYHYYTSATTTAPLVLQQSVRISLLNCCPAQVIFILREFPWKFSWSSHQPWYLQISFHFPRPPLFTWVWPWYILNIYTYNCLYKLCSKPVPNAANTCGKISPTMLLSHTVYDYWLVTQIMINSKIGVMHNFLLKILL